jgi:REP element-mobilizing transposase RayT
VYSYEYRRRLPHFQPDFKIIFITFCTYLRWTLTPDARTIVVDTCVAGNGLKSDLYGLVVMPDHVHLALVPVCDSQGPVPMAEIMQAIKGASAHRINRLLNRRGRVWQEESFDRALRKEEQAQEKLFYMLQNPLRAGLVSNPLDYPWIWRRTSTTVVGALS